MRHDCMETTLKLRDGVQTNRQSMSIQCLHSPTCRCVSRHSHSIPPLPISLLRSRAAHPAGHSVSARKKDESRRAPCAPRVDGLGELARYICSKSVTLRSEPREPGHASQTSYSHEPSRRAKCRDRRMAHVFVTVKIDVRLTSDASMLTLDTSKDPRVE